MSGYLLLDMTNADYSLCIAAATAIQASHYPDNLLSVVPNNDSTQAVVKVGGGTEQDFRDYFFPGADPATDTQDLIAAATGSPVLMAHLGNAEVLVELEKPEWSWLKGGE